ncbi:MAG TPA: phosphoglucosamine mutase [Planctomycetes bacterium]|nr:phosphoglucosamine mutase [Planctomycetota bacterium]
MTLFGTDGIRGRASRAPLVPEDLGRIAAIFASQLIHGKSREGARILIGNDGRRSAGMIEAALAASLTFEGCEVVDAGLLTTPVLAHETRLRGFDSGIMISASHNPAHDNGIKFFSRDGSKLPDEVEQAVEKAFEDGLRPRPAEKPGFHRRLADTGTAYLRFLQEEAFPGLSLKGIKILIDCANGGGSILAPQVLEAFGAEVTSMNDRPNGDNINRGCGALHPEELSREFEKDDYDLALCLDGDGDRSIFLDERGRVVHGDALLTLLALHLGGTGALPGQCLAVTVMSNLGLKKVLSQAGLQVEETPVGDRAVVAAMRRKGLALGGEPSGHVIFGEEHNYTGDGIYTCLKLLGVMQETGKPLSELASCFSAFPQLLVNVEVKEKPPLEGIPEILETWKKIEEELGGDGRIVLRYSGTEPLCRVMAEGPTETIVENAVRRIVEVVQNKLA